MLVSFASERGGVTRKIRFGPAEPAEVSAPEQSDSALVLARSDAGFTANRRLDAVFQNWAAPVIGVGVGLLAADLIDRFVERSSTTAIVAKRSSTKRRQRSRYNRPRSK